MGTTCRAPLLPSDFLSHCEQRAHSTCHSRAAMRILRRQEARIEHGPVSCHCADRIDNSASVIVVTVTLLEHVQSPQTPFHGPILQTAVWHAPAFTVNTIITTQGEALAYQ